MEDIVQLGNQYYIRASSALADQRTRVVKRGEVFGIFDVFGDIKPIGIAAQGIYKEATRYLSHMELLIAGKYPLFLSSTIKSDNVLMTVDLSNPDMLVGGELVRKASFHIHRAKFLSETGCFEEIQVTNFTQKKRTLDLSMLLGADFADMFEIRGVRRTKRGEILPVRREKSSVVFGYRGLDKISRFCEITFSISPQYKEGNLLSFALDCEPFETVSLGVEVECIDETSTPVRTNAVEVWNRIRLKEEQETKEECLISTNSDRFNAWLNRSKADIHLMITDTDCGPYPYAGIPWFNAAFGRDGIVAALQYIWVNPNVARGVLSFLARNQATVDDPAKDAEPGKILHELRKGEMVDTGEVPFKSYYGAADATPLFVVLAGAYLDATNDILFLEQLWPAIQSALKWIDRFGDIDGDGFVEYRRRSERGLTNQGWKDSSDSVSNKDGSLAEGPIALCEVQGYVYQAKTMAATVARRLGFLGQADVLALQARNLRDRFHDKFWIEEEKTYALALDGDKKKCEIKTSNAGHCLFSKIAPPHAATAIAQGLLSEDMFSGWGIRTLSEKEKRFNPMSYHNGSIWPHDNSMIAEGMAQYHLKDYVLKIFSSIFDAAIHFDLFRMPELYCGFKRRPGEGPTLYPVACAPQSWAAGSVFMLLKAALGLHVDAKENRITLYHPALPSVIRELSISGLKTQHSMVDLLLRRHGDEISVYVTKRLGHPEVNIIK